MKRYYVYVLRCADDTLYCGYTDDVQTRMKAHNDGKGAKYTKARRPVEVVYMEEFSSRSDALKREYAIKQMSREQKQRMIQENEQA